MESIQKCTQSHQVSQLLAVLFISLLFVTFLSSCVLLLVCVERVDSFSYCVLCVERWVQCVSLSLSLYLSLSSFFVTHEWSEWMNEWLRVERINFTLITLTIRCVCVYQHKYVWLYVVRVVIISIISGAVIVICVVDACDQSVCHGIVASDVRCLWWLGNASSRRLLMLGSRAHIRQFPTNEWEKNTNRERERYRELRHIQQSNYIQYMW